MNKEDIQKLLLKYPTKIPIYLDIQSNHLVKTRIKYMFEKTLTLQYVLNIITKQKYNIKQISFQSLPETSRLHNIRLEQFKFYQQMIQQF